MTTIFWLRKPAFLFTLLAILSLGACKKSKTTPDPEPEEPSIGANTKQTQTTDRTALTNDSLYLYAKQIYYWNDVLPAYDDFEPRKYGSNYNGELFAITQTKINPITSKPYEYLTFDPANPKYSFIEDVTQRNPDVIAAVPNSKADVDSEGNGNDVGIRPVFYLTNNQNRSYLLFITAVYPGSDAEMKGVKRGWVITKVNGQSIGANYDNEHVSVENTIDANMVTLEGYQSVNGKPGAPYTITLNKTNYKSNPIYLSKVVTAGNKKVGYLAYARFSSQENSFPVLDAAFKSFAAAGVTDLIIDLRYNGGGYVNTAEHLVNLIAPSTASGVMYKEYFNATLRDRKATIMKNQFMYDENGRLVNYFDNIDYSVAGNTHIFNKAGTLTAVTNVVFIVSENTASASELVMNSLKPVMNVKLVGEKTYGKPIGFFPIRLQNKYDVYFSMFETKNALDQGGYFDGMIPEYAEYEDPTYDFGDENERFLAKAIAVLNPSAAPAIAALNRSSMMSIGDKRVDFSSKNLMKPINGSNEFIGMIETPGRIKK